MILDLAKEAFSLISKFVGDEDKAQEIADRIAARAHELHLKEIEVQKEQIKTNQMEVQTGSKFIGG